MSVYRYLFVLVCLLTVVGVVACGGEAPTVDVPTATVAVEVGSITGGGAAEEPTVAPTAEPAPPTAVATLPPPATVAAPPTTTPSPTPEVTPTPEIVTLLSLDDFGDNRNPLTGELVEDPAVLERIPIACKITNHPAKYTRPQSGISSADIIFEHINLWSSTRFTVIWYDETPEEVGPVRSARLIDKEIPAMYHSSLCFSGANVGVSQTLFGSDISQRILRSNVDGYYRREDLTDRPSEHTLYTVPEMLWAELETRGFGERPRWGAVPVFDTRPQEGGEPASAMTLDLIDEIAYWEYDAESGRYWRWSDDEPHTDALNDEQLSAKNVVVLYVPHVDNASICAVPNADGSCLAYSIEIQMWGTNRAWVFRDGQKYEGWWRREARGDMLTFYDNDGEPIPLQVGNIFFQVMPATWQNRVEVTP